MPFQGGPGQRQIWMVALAVLAAVFLNQQVLLPLEGAGDPARQTYHANDLKHLYLGGRLLLAGEDPYPYENLRRAALEVPNPENPSAPHPDMAYLNPYVYPPFTGYLFGWLGMLSYDTAKWLWFWGSQLLLVLSLLLFINGPGGRPSLGWTCFLVASVAFSFPLFRSVTAGQLNHVLLFLLSVVFALWRNGRKGIAGAVLGFAALVKVQPAFLVLWLAWKREWTALVAALITVAVCVLGPGVIHGLGPYFAYYDVLGDMAYGSSTWSDQGASFHVDPGNIGVPALIYRLFAENPKTTPWLNLGVGAYWLCALWALGVLGLCLACCRVRRRDEDPEMELSAWVFGMLLIPSLFWDHYLALAIPAWVTLVARLSHPGVGDGLRAVVAICWVWANWWFLWFNPAHLKGLSMLYLNASLPPVLALFGMCLWQARTQERRVPSGEW
ncbi:MAG: DUF2029 domain-containing protein [Candidatus Omnitrophica bacterium]|nr:DUF2029 domain-containing protein [Candidatus Omnitrophota bacterium]